MSLKLCFALIALLQFAVYFSIVNATNDEDEPQSQAFGAAGVRNIVGHVINGTARGTAEIPIVSDLTETVNKGFQEVSSLDEFLENTVFGLGADIISVLCTKCGEGFWKAWKELERVLITGGDNIGDLLQPVIEDLLAEITSLYPALGESLEGLLCSNGILADIIPHLRAILGLDLNLLGGDNGLSTLLKNINIVPSQVTKVVGGGAPVLGALGNRGGIHGENGGNGDILGVGSIVKNVGLPKNVKGDASKENESGTGAAGGILKLNPASILGNHKSTTKDSSQRKSSGGIGSVVGSLGKLGI